MPYQGLNLVSRRRIYRLIPGVIFVLGLFLTWIEVSDIRQQETSQALAELNIRTDDLISDLERRFSYNAGILQGVTGLFASSDQVSRNEFSRYVRQLKFPVYNPGIRMIGYSELVTEAGKSSHIAAVRAEGFPDYDIHPAGVREHYSPLIYVESPDLPYGQIMGYDILAEPLQMQAATQARDSGAVVMTGKLPLQQETAYILPSNVFLFSPVYRNNQPIATVEQRQAAFRGWVTAAIRFDALLMHHLQQVHSDFPHLIAIRLYSGKHPDPRNIVIDTYPPDLSDINGKDLLRTAEILGTDWTLQIKPLPAYLSDVMEEKSSNIVLSAGIILSLFSAFLSYVMVSSHLRVASALLNAEQANLSLAKQEALLRAVYDSSSVAVLLMSNTGKIIYTNQRVAELFRQPYDGLPGCYVYQLLTEQQQTELKQAVAKILCKKTESFVLEQRCRRSDGSDLLILVNGQPFRSKTGDITGIVIVLEDITERRKNEAGMQLASTVLDASPGGILVTDADQRIIAVNPAFTRLTGYSLEDILYQNPSILSSGRQSKDFYRAMWAAIQQYGHWEGELVNRRKDGQLLPELLSISRVVDKKGNTVNYVGMFLDITERWEAETRTQYLAHHDYLTGLPNRLALTEHAAHTLTIARRYKRRLAIFYVDLDRFKPINDEYGHNVGDVILKTVAQRLLGMVRESDTVCRQGGDEFVILLPEFTDLAHLEMLAIKIRDEIQKPCLVSGIGNPLTVSASIGIATYPDDGETVETLIQAADTAMYQAKADIEKHICFASSFDMTRIGDER